MLLYRLTDVQAAISGAKDDGAVACIFGADRELLAEFPAGRFRIGTVPDMDEAVVWAEIVSVFGLPTVPPPPMPVTPPLSAGGRVWTSAIERFVSAGPERETWRVK